MRVFLTGGTGVIGRPAIPLLEAAGHDVDAPAHGELDLFDAHAVRAAVRGHDAIVHLASRIPSRGRTGDADAWVENDRLRREATRLLVEGGLRGGAEAFVLASVAFLGDPVRPHLRSALAAEAEAARYTAAGRRGVVLRFGLLDGPRTGHDEPHGAFGTTLHVDDAARAVVEALTLPAGVYRVDREHTSAKPQRLPCH